MRKGREEPHICLVRRSDGSKFGWSMQELMKERYFFALLADKRVGGLLNPGSIAPIFKRVAQWIGLSAKYVARIGGHSTRVDATQALAALDIDLVAITQAGE